MILKKLKTPYYAVIFRYERTQNSDGYNETVSEMQELVKGQRGFLGMESIGEQEGIAISYWDSLDAIEKWRKHKGHVIAREKGKKIWYKSFKVEVVKVERAYEFDKK